MNIIEENAQESKVSGRAVFLVGEKGIPNIISDKEFCRVNKLNVKWLTDNRSIVNRFKDLKFGFYQLDSEYIPWTVSIVLDSSNGPQLVQIENHICSNCGWKGKIANPCVRDFFYGTECPEKLFKNAFDQDFLSCPKCGEPLNRPAIWLETV